MPLQKEYREIPVFDGLALQFGNRIEGPAIIEQVNTSTFVTPEYHLVVDRYGTMTIYLPVKEDEVLRRIGK